MSQLNEVYPIFLDMGHTPHFFYSLSFGEIKDMVKSFERNELKRLKDQLLMADIQSSMIQDKICVLVDPKHKPQSLYERYPDLFADEMALQHEKAKNVELENNKAAFRVFANAKKARR